MTQKVHKKYAKSHLILQGNHSQESSILHKETEKSCIFYTFVQLSFTTQPCPKQNNGTTEMSKAENMCDDLILRITTSKMKINPMQTKNPQKWFPCAPKRPWVDDQLSLLLRNAGTKNCLQCMPIHMCCVSLLVEDDIQLKS